ncbi:MAG: SUMF1/EgtB/PvdO family nonheme iron enzyme [Verrucomicrobiota bacterium]
MEIRTAAPRIPDHEVLRCIGKGSYGEVWLARAVTGTLRAVKVVRREDFELDRTFEREFEGIMKFEPISREHPGLVHVLHVGRNDEEKFYYYVMELGDDRERGSRVDPADYEPRTMGTDRTLRHRLPVSDCIEYGAQVAEGLGHMHECGLTHRDIKPSNIIFVNGKAKLADIGLVAAAGQMTFVGTEGFVPPEGPGTKLADVYSLGMVLYELSTGKDRLLFPELPDDLGEARTRPQWQALNEIILRACANQPKKRFPSAREMAVALRAAGRKKQNRVSWTKRLIQFPLVTAAVAFVIVTWRHQGAMPWPPGRFAGPAGIAPSLPQMLGKVRLESNPDSAEIYLNGTFLGRTPWICEVPPGEAHFLLKRKPYRDETVTVSGIEPDKLSAPPLVQLRPTPPAPHVPGWRNSLDMPFDPQPDGSHISKWAVSEAQFNKIQGPQKGAILLENTAEGATIYMMGVPHVEALRFCAQLTAWETQGEWINDDQYYRPEVYHAKDPTKEKPGLEFFRLVVEKYGRLKINSTPPGAAIYEGDSTEPLNFTPYIIERQLPGELDFTLSLPGYTDVKITDKLKPGEYKELPGDPVMVKSSLAVFGSVWKNSLGQVFKPLLPTAPQLLVGDRETRVSDYAAFAKEEKGRQARGNDMRQAPNHPVVNITRGDAVAFCHWLTRRERKSGYLNETMEYRLPTDTEWSLAAASANLVVEQVTPAQRHMTLNGLYPWNSRYWPPTMANPQGNARSAANLGDLSALRAGVLRLKPDEIKALEDSHYDDGSVFTSAAETYAPGAYGLFDMSGNVWEFVADDYGNKTADSPPDPAGTPDQSKYAVLRGGAWDTSAADEVKLAIHYRRAIPPDKYDATSGFRIVVAPVPGEETDIQPPPASTYLFPLVTPPAFSQPSTGPLPGNPVPPMQLLPAPGPAAGPGTHSPREAPRGNVPPAPAPVTSPSAEPPP